MINYLITITIYRLKNKYEPHISYSKAKIQSTISPINQTGTTFQMYLHARGGSHLCCCNVLYCMISFRSPGAMRWSHIAKDKTIKLHAAITLYICSVLICKSVVGSGFFFLLFSSSKLLVLYSVCKVRCVRCVRCGHLGQVD